MFISEQRFSFEAGTFGDGDWGGILWCSLNDDAVHVEVIESIIDEFVDDTGHDAVAGKFFIEPVAEVAMVIVGIDGVDINGSGKLAVIEDVIAK